MNDSNASHVDLEKKRAELLAVLEQFKLKVSYFDSLHNSCLERYVASISAQQLRELYLMLLQPGIPIPAVSAWCPLWPKGFKNPGGRPTTAILYVIRKCLINARKRAEGDKERAFAIREKQIQLREMAMLLGQQKAELAAQAAKPAEQLPAVPEPPQETADEMFIRIYGKNPFKKQNKPS